MASAIAWPAKSNSGCVLVLVLVLAELWPVEREGLAEHGGEGRRPCGEHPLVVAGGPVLGGLARQHPVLAVGVEYQPLDAERVLPQEGEVLLADAEGHHGLRQALGGQVAILVYLTAVLAYPVGEQGQLADDRRGAGTGGELGQRQQPDGREGVGQPERLLDVDVLVVEVIVVDVMDVVVGHAPSLSARRQRQARKPLLTGRKARALHPPVPPVTAAQPARPTRAKPLAGPATAPAVRPRLG